MFLLQSEYQIEQTNLWADLQEQTSILVQLFY